MFGEVLNVLGRNNVRYFYDRIDPVADVSAHRLISHRHLTLVANHKGFQQ